MRQVVNLSSLILPLQALQQGSVPPSVCNFHPSPPIGVQLTTITQLLMVAGSGVTESALLSLS